jgi:hypothetical protein
MSLDSMSLDSMSRGLIQDLKFPDSIQGLQFQGSSNCHSAPFPDSMDFPASYPNSGYSDSSHSDRSDSIPALCC